MENEKMASMPVAEQETTISYCREEETANIWTTDRTVMTKLDRLVDKAPENYAVVKIYMGADDGLVYAKTYTIKDKGLVSFRPRRPQLKLTEEMKKERVRRMNEKKHDTQ